MQDSHRNQHAPIFLQPNQLRMNKQHRCGALSTALVFKSVDISSFDSKACLLWGKLW